MDQRRARARWKPTGAPRGRRPRTRTAGLVVALGGLATVSLGAVTWTLGDDPSPAAAAAGVEYDVDVFQDGGPPSSDLVIGDSVTYVVRIQQSVDDGPWTPVVGVQPHFSAPGPVGSRFQVCPPEGTDAAGHLPPGGHVPARRDHDRPGVVPARARGSDRPGRPARRGSTSASPSPGAHRRRRSAARPRSTSPSRPTAAAGGCRSPTPASTWRSPGVPGGSPRAARRAAWRSNGLDASHRTDADGRILGIALTSPTAGTTTLRAHHRALVSGVGHEFDAAADVAWTAADAPATTGPPARPTSTSSATTAPTSASTSPATAAASAPAAPPTSAAPAVVTVAPPTVGLTPAQATPTSTPRRRRPRAPRPPRPPPR